MDDSNINKLISGVHNGYIYDEELNRFLLHVELINKSNNPDPEFKTSGAAGMDIRANITSDFINEISGNLVHSDNSIFLPSGSFLAIPTGIYMKVPESYEIQVRPRSGLAFKHGVTVLNSPGTIDSDYTGEIKVILINHGKNSFEINHGDRIAQLVISNVMSKNTISFKNVESFSGGTERGSGGFGSTGVK